MQGSSISSRFGYPSFMNLRRFFGALGHLILIRSWISTAISKEVAVQAGWRMLDADLTRAKCLPGRNPSTASSTLSVSSQMGWLVSLDLSKERHTMVKCWTKVAGHTFWRERQQRDGTSSYSEMPGSPIVDSCNLCTGNSPASSWESRTPSITRCRGSESTSKTTLPASATFFRI